VVWGGNLNSAEIDSSAGGSPVDVSFAARKTELLVDEIQ
jgi:hypothetical protein